MSEHLENSDQNKIEDADVNSETKSKITFANDVIATIVALAAAETDGVASMSGTKGISEILGGKKSITKGVKVEVGSEEVAVDLYAIVKYGYKIQEVAQNIQKNVSSAIENMTGLRVVEVNVSIEGIYIEKDEPQKSEYIIEEPPVEEKVEYNIEKAPRVK